MFYVPKNGNTMATLKLLIFWKNRQPGKLHTCFTMPKTNTHRNFGSCFVKLIDSKNDNRFHLQWFLPFSQKSCDTYTRMVFFFHILCRAVLFFGVGIQISSDKNEDSDDKILYHPPPSVGLPK